MELTVRGTSSIMSVARTRALLGAVAAGGVMAATLHAAPAHADQFSFISDIRAANFDTSEGGNTTILGAGLVVCTALDAGHSPEEIAEAFFERSQLGSLDRAREFVGIAQQDLCTTGAVT